MSPLILSLLVSAVATMLVVLVGTLLAWRFVYGRRIPGQGLIEILLTLPMVLPPTVVGYYLLLLLGQGTAFGRWLNESVGLRLLFTWEGAAIAAAVLAFPLYLRTVQAAFGQVDPDVVEASRVLGAREGQILSRVIVPLSLRGMAAGATLAFARAIGEFGATLMVAGSIPGRTQTMPLALYEAVNSGKDGEAIRYTILLTLVATAVLSLITLLQTRGLRYRGEV